MAMVPDVDFQEREPENGSIAPAAIRICSSERMTLIVSVSNKKSLPKIRQAAEPH